ncbi:hypothetical protein ACFX2J_017382 [Malus domestica]
MDHLGIHAIARESRSYSCRKSSSGGRWWGPPKNTVMKLNLALAAEVTAGPFHARLFVVPTFPICPRPIGRKRKASPSSFSTLSHSYGAHFGDGPNSQL